MEEKVKMELVNVGCIMGRDICKITKTRIKNIDFE